MVGEWLLGIFQLTWVLNFQAGIQCKTARELKIAINKKKAILLRQPPFFNQFNDS